MFLVKKSLSIILDILNKRDFTIDLFVNIIIDKGYSRINSTINDIFGNKLIVKK